MVAKNKPTGNSNPFTMLTGGKTPQIYKNGVPAQVSDIRQYDVGTYDKNSNTLFVSDLRLCGLYEDASPNAAAPSTITVMGATLEVLPSAVADLSAFKVGDKVTFLLSSSGQVAGAVSPSVAQSNAIGVAKVDGSSATVQLLDGQLTLTGKTSMSAEVARQFSGWLVNVSSYSRGYLSLSKVNGSGATRELDLAAGKLGDKTLSPGVRFFEQAGNGALAEIQRDDITIDKVPANKVTYVGYDWAGRVDKLVLNDVTGDRYIYGMIYYIPSDQEDENATIYDHVTVENSGGSQSFTVFYLDGVKGGQLGGIAPGLSQLGDGTEAVGYMSLRTLNGVQRNQFDVDNMMLTTNEMVIPVSDQVECYNKATGQWYKAEGEDGHQEALKQILAFSNSLTVYYDRAPEQGGKVRIVVAE